MKAALHGGDPNWGRIAQAVGGALPDRPLALDIWIEETQVCAGGVAIPYDEAALALAVSGDEVEYTSCCPAAGPRRRSSSPTSRTTT